ncbi:BZIP domain-containing protein [Aphelenchoides fujianensis]|nr:BZIP domain-containing protein [Aphelenchoides fujianensis]
MAKTVYIVRGNTAARPGLRQMATPAYVAGNQIAICEPPTAVKSHPARAQRDLSPMLFDTPQTKPPRRRERLTHLSAEEKLNRRKMKNREAAQNARDRKKEQSRRLEDTVRQLIKENKQLRAENARLRSDFVPQESVHPAAYTTVHSPQSVTLSESSLTPGFPAVDSGYDELRAESPSLVGECVELFSPLESTPAEAVMYADEFDYEQCAVQPFAAQTQWTADAVASPPAYAPQQFAGAADLVDPSGFPADFVDERAMQNYEDLVKSPFVNELCGELDRWNEEIEAVGGDPMASHSMPSAALDFPAEEFAGLEDLDLFGFCNV